MIRQDYQKDDESKTNQNYCQKPAQKLKLYQKSAQYFLFVQLILKELNIKFGNFYG